MDKPALYTGGCFVANALIAATIYEFWPDSAFSLVFAIFAGVTLVLCPFIYTMFGGRIS